MYAFVTYFRQRYKTGLEQLLLFFISKAETEVAKKLRWFFNHQNICLASSTCENLRWHLFVIWHNNGNATALKTVNVHRPSKFCLWSYPKVMGSNMVSFLQVSFQLHTVHPLKASLRKWYIRLMCHPQITYMITLYTHIYRENT